MIRPLRRTHLHIWIALALLLPLLFICALMVRRTTTPVNPGVRWEQLK